MYIPAYGVLPLIPQLASCVSYGLCTLFCVYSCVSLGLCVHIYFLCVFALYTLLCVCVSRRLCVHTMCFCTCSHSLPHIAQFIFYTIYLLCQMVCTFVLLCISVIQIGFVVFSLLHSELVDVHISFCCAFSRY